MSVMAEAAKPRKGRGNANRIIGAVLLAVGVGALADQIGVVSLSLGSLLALAMVVLGAGIVIDSRSRHITLIVAGSLLGLALTASTIVPPEITFPALEGGLQQARVRPMSVGELRDYSIAAGELALDLTALDLPEGPTRVSAAVGMGRVVVIIPAGVGVEVRTNVGAGDVRIFGLERGSGTRIKDHFVSQGFESAPRKISLTIQVGLGAVEVTGAAA